MSRCDPRDGLISVLIFFGQNCPLHFLSATQSGAAVTEMQLIQRIGRRRGFLRSGRAAILLSGPVVAIILGLVGFTIWHNHQSVLAERERGAKSMGVVLAEQTARYVQVIDLSLKGVRSSIAALDLTSPDDFRRRLGTPEFHSLLADSVRNIPQVNAIVLLDAGGRILNSSRPAPASGLGRDVSGRDFYLYFKTHDDPNMFIGSLSKGIVTGDLSLFFVRRISGPDGSLLGLVVGIADTRYLNEFYQAASANMGEAVTLLRRDGTMLTRYPDPAKAIGVKLPQKSPWFARVAEGGGNYMTPGILNPAPSLVTVQPLRDYPLVIDVLMDEATIFADWRRQAIYIVGFALAAAFSFSGLFWVLTRQFRWQAMQNAKLEEAAICLSEGQQKLRSYAEMSVDWFWEQDTDFRFTRRTDTPFMTGSDDTGMTRWELAGDAMTDEQWVPHKADLVARIPFRDFRWERHGLDGARHYMTISGDPMFDRNGVFSGYRGTGREITAEVQANARLAQANTELAMGRQQIDAVLSNITHAICMFDRAQRLLVWNRRYIEMYNLPPEAARVGISLKEFLEYRKVAGTTSELTSAEYLAWCTQLGVAKRPSSRVLTLKNGRTVLIHYQPMDDGGWVATHEDITERQKAETDLAFMAQHDALTRLPNRMLFGDRLEQAMATAGRGSQFALLCLDLDHFKAVNDTLGHPIGDGLLQMVAERLRSCVRVGDTVARLGGDEFAIIQLAVTQPVHAELLASRVIAAFSRPFDVEGHQMTVGISVGVTVSPGDGVLAETLLRNADLALYSAKTSGRGVVRFFEPEMDARIQIRRTLERDLRDAIVRKEFEIYYQPLIGLVSGKITGFEALLRWHHPIRGLVSPMEFIPVAEETGMIVAIGAWVLRMACFEAENWPVDIGIAVNLSPVQFRKGDLAASVQAALIASGLRPGRLELEITESVLLDETVGTLTLLHQLRAMGVAIALDDFGTGYSSLSYLRSFPFDKIKIDQSFVRDLVKNKESMSIIRAVIGLGHSLSIKTTAEGVETPEQLERLREEGCTEVQGYLFSRPRPASEVPMLIEKLQHIGQAPDVPPVR
jgi:diguanylate cyclase (GGDEF)-like protein